jgi:hypothetical protein
MAEPESPADTFLFGSTEVTLTGRNLRVRWANGITAVVPFATICHLDILDEPELRIDAGQLGQLRLVLPVGEQTDAFVTELQERRTEARPHPSPRPTLPPRPFYAELADDERWIFFHARRDTLQLAVSNLLTGPPDADRARTSVT